MKDDFFMFQAPITTPMQPPVGLPQLAAYLRARGRDPTIVDLNILLLNALMTESVLSRCLSTARLRLQQLDSLPALGPREALEYVPLLQHAGLTGLPGLIESAVATFRSREHFYNPSKYFGAAQATQQALGLISATIHPFHIDFNTCVSVRHNLDSSNELFEAVDVFASAHNNVVLETLSELLDATLGPARPRLVGISITYSRQLLLGLVLAALVRRRFPTSHITLGGPFVASLANRDHRLGRHSLFRHVDSIVVSDGEEALHQLASYVLADRRVPPIDNVILYDRVTDVGHLRDVVALPDLDAVPCADFDDFVLDAYWTPTPVLPIPIARGCYWDKCTFCHYGFVPDGRRATAPYRERSVASLVADLRRLQERHHCSHFDFTVDLASPAYLERLTKVLQEASIDVKWMLELRAEKTFTRERCERLYRTGLRYVAFGLESMDQATLDAIQKGTTVSQYATVLANFHTSGIATHGMGFFDFPTEDYDAACATLRFLREHQQFLSEVGWGSFALDRNSFVDRHADAFGIQRIDMPDEDLALVVRFAQTRPSKTALQQQRVKVQFEEWQRSSLKLTFLGRPFITGGSLEPHSLLWAARYGPGGSDLFNRVAARLVSPTLSDARDLRLTTAPLRVHYSPVDAWTFYESLLGLIDADNTQPLLTIGTGSKPARHRRLDECSIAIHRSGARLVVATPKGVHEITEAQWQLIRWVTEQPRIDQAQAHSDATTWRLLRDGVAAGWLEPLHTDLAAPS